MRFQKLLQCTDKLLLLDEKFGLLPMRTTGLDLNFIPMFAEPTQGQVKVTENILELIS
jgi:hypothetical protein